MDARILLTLLVISLILLPSIGPDKMDKATQQRMREREELLNHEVTRLLQEQKQGSQSSSAWGVPRSAASQQWHMWASAAVLVLCIAFCWWLRKRSSGNNVDMENHEENPGIPLEWHCIPCTCSLNLPEITSVYEVMDELLRMCQEQSKKDFFPVLQTPVSIRTDTEDPSHRPYFGICGMLIPVKAPCGHSFHLERCAMGEEPLKGYEIRVQLESSCEKEEPDNDMLCFLHHSKEELSRNQPPSLLDTLCTGSYLDTVKTACWFKKLVKSSWKAVPEVKGCHLKVLPTRHHCRLQLMCTANVTVLIEIELQVEEG